MRATFFINSDNLAAVDQAEAERNKATLIRIVAEGHLLGDHSYDHMVCLSLI